MQQLTPEQDKQLRKVFKKHMFSMFLSSLSLAFTLMLYNFVSGMAITIFIGPSEGWSMFMGFIGAFVYLKYFWMPSVKEKAAVFNEKVKRIVGQNDTSEM